MCPSHIGEEKGGASNLESYMPLCDSEPANSTRGGHQRTVCHPKMNSKGRTDAQTTRLQAAFDQTIRNTSLPKPCWRRAFFAQVPGNLAGYERKTSFRFHLPNMSKLMVSHQHRHPVNRIATKILKAQLRRKWPLATYVPLCDTEVANNAR